MEEQTIRNLFEAFLQTSYLSPENVVELLRIRKDLKEDLAERRSKIREKFLDSIQMWNEPDVDVYIDELFRYIN